MNARNADRCLAARAYIAFHCYRIMGSTDLAAAMYLLLPIGL